MVQKWDYSQSVAVQSGGFGKFLDPENFEEEDIYIYIYLC